jgi:hypothetical protein
MERPDLKAEITEAAFACIVSWRPRGAGENESNENSLGMLDEPVLPMAAECKARVRAALLYAASPRRRNHSRLWAVAQSAGSSPFSLARNSALRQKRA